MEILTPKSTIPQNVSLILGFFDGVHAGHQNVINNTPENKKILVTFSSSPAEYFGKEFNYIYPREYNYKLIEKTGVDYIYVQVFSQIAKLTATEYLKKLVSLFKPKSITTGFNHTFGANKQGNPDFLTQHQSSFKYYCTEATIINNDIVSSTLIKNKLENCIFILFT